jgi:hypothetical protein
MQTEKPTANFADLKQRFGEEDQKAASFHRLVT